MEKLAIYFIHAFPLNARMWDEQLNFFAGRCSVITMDLPGFGKSDHTTVPDNPSIEHYAQFVENVVKSSHRGGKTCLVGLSMGGYITMSIMKRGILKPDFVVLANTRSYADTPEVREKRLELIEKVNKTQSIEPVLEAYLPSLAPYGSPIREKVESIARESSVEGVKKALYAMAHREDMTDIVLRWEGKILIIAGENDKLSPPDVMRAMVGDGKNRKMCLIAGAGHLSNMEKPSEFNRVLLDFLGI